MIDFLKDYWLPASLAGGLFTLLALLLRPLWARQRALPGRVLIGLACLLFLLPFAPLAQLALSAGLLRLPLAPPALAQALAAKPADNSGPAAPAASTHPDILDARASGALSGGLARPESPTQALGPETTSQLLSAAPASMPGAETAPSTAQAALPGQTSLQNRVSFPALPVGTLWPALYLAGLLGTGALLVFRYRQLLHRLHQSRTPVDSPELLAQYQALCEEYRLRRPPTLYRSSALRSPVLAGFLHPALYLPSTPMTEEQTGFALRHELTHQKHGDIPLKIALLALCTLHWCNPLAWLLNRLAAENSETLCDETVASRLPGGQRCAYAATLLAFAATPRLPGPVSAFSYPAKTLKRRLESLIHPKNPPRILRAAAMLALSFTLVLGLLAGCAVASATQTESEQPGTSAAPAASTPPEPTGTGASGDDSLAFKLEMLWPLSGGSAPASSLEQSGGMSISADAGSPILAAAAGTVTTLESEPEGYGNYLAIDHGEGLITLYAHCENILVEKGQAVQAGQEIATVGETGLATGPTLHFEIHKNGVLQKPIEYLSLPFYEPGKVGLPFSGAFTQLPHTDENGDTIGWLLHERQGVAAKAAAPGTVIKTVMDDEMYGNYIVVYHGDGLETLYGYCDMILAKEGDFVYAQDSIATEGANGLLYQVLKDGQPQNPQEYLDEMGRSSLGFAQTIQTYTDTAGSTKAFLAWPVPSSGTISEEGGPGQGHRGLDIAAEAGSSIVAAAPGKVTTAGWHYSYGNHVVLEHENGLVTLYAHCQKLLVEEGQTVAAGEEIATVGNTGYTTGSALHFEVQQQAGGLLNPLDYVEAPSPAGPQSGQADGDPDGMMFPVPEAKFISRGMGNEHRGVDIGAPAGSTIVAASPGTVTTADVHESYGNYVVIDHGNGILTLYAHCQELLVEEGQTVAAGEEIATVGSTGYTTGSALHFEVQQKTGGLLNPLDYITTPSSVITAPGAITPIP